MVQKSSPEAEQLFLDHSPGNRIQLKYLLSTWSHFKRVC